MTEPSRERVEAYEAALGCEKRIGIDDDGPFCGEHGDRWLTDYRNERDGCPVAVAAARFGAEETAALRAVVEQVRALAVTWRETVVSYDGKPYITVIPRDDVLAVLPAPHPEAAT